jgi:hypothetical protein
MKIRLFTFLAFAAVPTFATTFTITDITDPNGVTTNAKSPFTFVLIPNGTASSDGLVWTGVGAGITTFSSVTDLGFFGNFSCPTVSGCSDTFEVDFGATGFASGTTAFVALHGSSSNGSASLQVFGGNQSLGFVSSNSSTINVTSSSILVGNPANFSGDMLINITLANGGTLNLPGGTTADLVTTQGSAPEPGTLGIVAACGLLLFYVRRLRKA